MKCPICGNELEIRNKQIGTDNSGDPVFNEYAVCRDCKKQWNLDKQRAKKAAAKANAKKTVSAETTGAENNAVQKKSENKNKNQVKSSTPKSAAKDHAEDSAEGAKRSKTASEAQRQTTSKSPAPRQNRKPTAKPADGTTVQFPERSEKKAPKSSLHPNRLLKNQIRMKTSATAISHRHVFAQNEKKPFAKAMKICLQPELSTPIK